MLLSCEHTCEARAVSIASATVLQSCNNRTRSSTSLLTAAPRRSPQPKMAQCSQEKNVSWRKGPPPPANRLRSPSYHTQLHIPTRHAATTTALRSERRSFLGRCGRPVQEATIRRTKARGKDHSAFHVQRRCADGFTMKCACLSPVPKACNQTQSTTRSTLPAPLCPQQKPSTACMPNAQWRPWGFHFSPVSAQKQKKDAMESAALDVALKAQASSESSAVARGVCEGHDDSGVPNDPEEALVAEASRGLTHRRASSQRMPGCHRSGHPSSLADDAANSGTQCTLKVLLATIVPVTKRKTSERPAHREASPQQRTKVNSLQTYLSKAS